jgi:hypothetical protein
MPCNITITGRGYPCKDAIGGVRRFWVKAFDPDGSNWGTVTAGALAGAAEAITVYSFQLTKNTASFVQTINASMETGNVFYSQVLEVTIPKMEAAVNAEIADLVKTRLCVIVETANGERLVMGLLNGVDVTGGTITTGTAAGDLHGYTLTFTAEEKLPAPVLSATTNITYTSET